VNDPAPINRENTRAIGLERLYGCGRASSNSKAGSSERPEALVGESMNSSGEAVRADEERPSGAHDLVGPLNLVPDVLPEAGRLAKFIDFDRVFVIRPHILNDDAIKLAHILGNL
jgi:hypothetical protein